MSDKKNMRTGNERGQILVIVGIIMPVLLAFVGLVLDTGFLYAESRGAQAAADSVALAAATYMYDNKASTVDCSTQTGSGTDTCGALAYAAALGYDVGGVTVTVTHPAGDSGVYASTEYHARGDYVKVTIEKELPKFFIGFIFEAASRANVTSVAGIARVPMEYALISLGSPCTSAVNNTQPGANGGIVVSGSGNLTVNNGGMFSNCAGSPAVNVNGSGSLTGDGIQTSGTCTPSSLPCEIGMAPINDPMGTVPWPCSTAATGNTATLDATHGYCVNRGSITGNVGTVVAEPGVYNAISPSGNSTIWLKSGIYVIRGGFSNEAIDLGGNTGIRDCSQSGAPVGCGGATGGVLIYNATNEYSGARSPQNSVATTPNPCSDGVNPAPTGGEIALTGSTGFQIKALTTGPFTNLALWQGCGLSSTISLTGSTGSSITGTVYAPNALVDLDGSASWNTPSNIISSFTRMKGSSDLIINYNHSLAYKPYKVVLVQ